MHLQLSAMRPGNSSLHDLHGTSLVAASFQLVAMIDTKSFLSGLVGASIMVAPCVIHSLPLATLLARSCIVTLQSPAPWVIQTGWDILQSSKLHRFHLCAMHDTNSPFQSIHPSKLPFQSAGIFWQPTFLLPCTFFWLLLHLTSWQWLLLPLDDKTNSTTIDDEWDDEPPWWRINATTIDDNETRDVSLSIQTELTRLGQTGGNGFT